MNCAETVSIAKDVIIALAALATAIVASVSIAKWKKELAYREAFDASRNLLRATLKLRDDVAIFRSPITFPNEFPAGFDQTPGKATSNEIADAHAFLYANRWSPVQSALREFDAHSLEAEVLWGASMRAQCNQLRNCIGELFNAVNILVANFREDNSLFRADPAYGISIRNTVAAFPNDPNDRLRIAIQSATLGIESELLNRVKRR